MERMIKVGGKPYKIRASAGALVIYKAQFGKDYPDELAELGDDNKKAFVVGCRLLWAMARAAKAKLPTPDEWINSFRDKELAAALIVSQQLFAFSVGDSEGRGSEKFSSEKLMASAALCGMGPSDLNSLPLGMVIDTIEEYAQIRCGEGGEYVSAAEFFGE